MDIRDKGDKEQHQDKVLFLDLYKVLFMVIRGGTPRWPVHFCH